MKWYALHFGILQLFQVVLCQFLVSDEHYSLVKSELEESESLEGVCDVMWIHSRVLADLSYADLLITVLCNILQYYALPVTVIGDLTQI